MQNEEQPVKENPIENNSTGIKNLANNNNMESLSSNQNAQVDDSNSNGVGLNFFCSLPTSQNYQPPYSNSTELNNKREISHITNRVPVINTEKLLAHSKLKDIMIKSSDNYYNQFNGSVLSLNENETNNNMNNNNANDSQVETYYEQMAIRANSNNSNLTRNHNVNNRNQNNNYDDRANKHFNDHNTNAHRWHSNRNNINTYDSSRNFTRRAQYRNNRFNKRRSQSINTNLSKPSQHGIRYQYRVKIIASSDLSDNYKSIDSIKNEILLYKNIQSEFFCTRAKSNEIYVLLNSKADFDEMLNSKWTLINTSASTTAKNNMPFGTKVRVENDSQFSICIHQINISKKYLKEMTSNGITELHQYRNHTKGEVNNIELYDKLISAGCFTIGDKTFRISPYNDIRIKSLIQCDNCYTFGHIEKACFHFIRCVACAGKHHFNECPNPTMLRCRNCNEPHRADYYNCPYRNAIVQGKVIAKSALKDLVTDMENRLLFELSTLRNEIVNKQDLMQNDIQTIITKLKNIELNIQKQETVQSEKMKENKLAYNNGLKSLTEQIAFLAIQNLQLQTNSKNINLREFIDVRLNEEIQKLANSAGIVLQDSNISKNQALLNDETNNIHLNQGLNHNSSTPTDNQALAKKSKKQNRSKSNQPNKNCKEANQPGNCRPKRHNNANANNPAGSIASSQM